MRRISTMILGLTAGLALHATPTQAQTIGFKLGASISNWDVSDTDETNQSSLTGFAGGGFIRFGGRLGLQAELLSITKGSQVDDLIGDDDLKVKLEYIEIPVLLHLPLTFGRSFAPYIMAGPTIAFEVGCNVEVAGIDFDCDDDTADEIIERESTDFGLAVGGGLAFAMGPGALLIEGRYTWGLKNLNAGAGPEVKNRSALFVVGYEIGLGRR